MKLAFFIYINSRSQSLLNQRVFKKRSISSMHMAATCSISALHTDIIETQILPRLDAFALASASCVSSQLYSLITSNETLWTNICNSTLPSTNTPRLCHVISTFPSGSRSFFSDSLTNPDIATTSSNLNLPSELISAVDIHFQKRHIFSKVVETKTETFNSSPFIINLLDPKESVPIGIPHQVNEDMYGEIAEGLTLSWILIDPIERRAMNLSSYKPVTVEISWLSPEEIHVRYAWVIFAGEEGTSLEYVKCGISVSCGESESGEMHVTEVKLQLQDSFGKQLSGEGSLVILKKGMVGKRGKSKGREEDGKRRYKEYLEMKRERIMMRNRTEETKRTIDTFRDNFSWVLIFVSLVLIFVSAY